MYIHCIALTQDNSTIYYISFLFSDTLWSTPPIYSALFADSFIFPSYGSSFFSLILRELIEVWGTNRTSTCGGSRVNYSCGEK